MPRPIDPYTAMKTFGIVNPPRHQTEIKDPVRAVNPEYLMRIDNEVIRFKCLSDLVKATELMASGYSFSEIKNKFE